MTDLRPLAPYCPEQLTNKTSQVRHYVLALLEQNALKAGDQIPAARDLARTLDISFLKVQQAIESLCRDGVLESLPRKGTFVQQDWEERVLPENIAVYTYLHRLPWLQGMLKVIQQEMPDVRMTHAFKKGMLELKTTAHVLIEHAEYMDLSEIFNEFYPDQSLFFEKPFQPFHVSGKVIGIPFSFSPRLIFFNEELFRKADCPLPHIGWTWEDFIECIRKLKRHLPANRIINWHWQSSMWMNFVMRAGGRLFQPDSADPVKIDSPETMKGLRLYAQLGEELEHVYYDDDSFRHAFLSGEAAMMLHGRQFLNSIKRMESEGWSTVPLPLIPGGVDTTAQATDLICVRKACTSRSLAKEYVRMMLSEAVQDYIGEAKYSIPIRKSSAFKSLDLTDPRDALFAVEMGKVSTDFNLSPPFPGGLVISGIERIFEAGTSPDKGIPEIAQMARTYLHIRGYMSKQERAAQAFSSQEKRPVTQTT